MEGTSLCIVTMNRPKQLGQLIMSIRKYAKMPYEIIIVDNGDGSSQFLSTLESEGETVINNGKNMGLSVATNQGLAAGKYDTLIHLDDDCLINHPGWNQTMRDFAIRDEIGLVHPTQTPHSIPHEDYQEMTWGLGICWAIPKTLFDDIGGYDAQLYHQNECDLGLRVRMAGFQVAGIPDFTVIHNDGGGPRPEASLAREHLGVVQFRDKWTQYFRGRGWNYGTQPLYLMQHWPPDQEFWHRFSIHHGVNLNPAPDEMNEAVAHYAVTHGKTNQEAHEEFERFMVDKKITIGGIQWVVWQDLRNDYKYWEYEYNLYGYEKDRQLAIERWFNHSGERYEGYQWPNLLKPQ